MAIKIYNTLTQEKKELTTLEANKIKMYVCGPTVYDDCHIGHLMGPVIFDTIARWLLASDFDVKFVNNITDIDDKIIQKSVQTGELWTDITHKYTNQYFDFLKDLKVTTITDFPRCTDFIPQMIDYTNDLIKKDRAYEIEDGVYYEVSKQPHYGKLSKRNLDDMLAGARIEANSQLKHPADFCLWKKAKPNEPSWPSPWGDGRPGWHLECSVMSNSLLGDTFDIHGGGDDLKFPHHENEIAQGEAYGGCYAKTWMHNGLIQYEGVKIGKSDPRMKDPKFAGQFKARFLIETYGAPTIRYFLIQGQYRRPNDFAPKNLEAAKQSLKKLHHFIGNEINTTDSLSLAEIKALSKNESITKSVEAFVNAMNDDFNTGAAIGYIFTLIKDAKKLSEQDMLFAQKTVLQLGRIIGLFQPGDVEELSKEPTKDFSAESLAILVELVKQIDPSYAGACDLQSLMQHILNKRQEFRSNKNYASADQIRDGLAKAKIVIKDSPTGPTFEVQA